MKFIRDCLLFSLLTICTVANAEVTQYVGAALHWKTLALKNSGNYFAKHGFGGNLFTGIRFDQMWGMEFGIHGLRTKKSGSIVKTRGIHMDLLGVVPLNESIGLDSIAGIGVTNYKFHAHHSKISTKSTKLVPRVLAGLEFKLSEYLKLRTTVVYETSLTTKRKTYRPKGNCGINLGLVLEL